MLVDGKNRRYGRVTVPMDLVNFEPEKLAMVLSGGVVLHVENRIDLYDTTFYMLHPLFDMITLYVVTPTYSIHFYDKGFSFSRDKGE